MKRPEMNLEDPDCMNEIEFEDICNSMDKYIVKFPDEEDIERTLDTLRQYVPTKGRAVAPYGSRLSLLAVRAIDDINYIDKTYWIISLVIYLIGYFAVNKSSGFHISPYLTVIALSPVPFIWGIVEVFRGREEGMLEIEMTCRISGAEVMFSRIILIGIYSVLLNTAFSIALDMTVFGINMWRLTLYWVTPLTALSGLSLWLAMRIRNSYAAAIASSVWGVLFIILFIRQKSMQWFMGLNTAAYLVIIALSLVIAVYQLKRLMYRYSDFERGGLLETYN